jgi:bifunctional non-homologous end joining protein LigD
MVHWRTVSTHRRRRPPAGFIPPCLPIVDDRIPTGPEWIHELKWHGYRMLARRGQGPARLWSRNPIEWSASFPQIVAALAALPVTSVKLDAEAVCLREDGRADFNRLRSRQGCVEARLIVFDLLELDGKDVRGLPLDERRRQLEWLLKDEPEALWYSSMAITGRDGEKGGENKRGLLITR